MRKKILSEEVHGELLVNQSKALLKELHLLTREGHLNADARRKLKQINHFADFIKTAYVDLQDRIPNPVLVDVASGNSYLGFILYEIFLKNNPSGQIFSIEQNPELAERSRLRALQLGYERMTFLCQSILETQFPERVHILTALHACDTATDDAIVLGIQNNIDYLFLVPCCQAEIARQLDPKQGERILGALFQNRHHRREFGAHLTNVIRTLVLKSFGYKVTVTELVSWEYSHKGELIIAKKVHAYNRQAKEDLSALLELFQVYPTRLKELAASRENHGH